MSSQMLQREGQSLILNSANEFTVKPKTAEPVGGYAQHQIVALGDIRPDVSVALATLLAEDGLALLLPGFSVCSINCLTGMSRR